jgi:hypothetical protein
VELVHTLLDLELKHTNEVLWSKVIVCALRNDYFELDRAANDLVSLVGE